MPLTVYRWINISPFLFVPKEMAAYKITALQKALDDSVPASELERANKQYTELTVKYRDVLQKDSLLVQKTSSLQHLEVVRHITNSKLSSLTKCYSFTSLSVPVRRSHLQIFDSFKVYLFWSFFLLTFFIWFWQLFHSFSCQVVTIQEFVGGRAKILSKFEAVLVFRTVFLFCHLNQKQS